MNHTTYNSVAFHFLGTLAAIKLLFTVPENQHDQTRRFCRPLCFRYAPMPRYRSILDLFSAPMLLNSPLWTSGLHAKLNQPGLPAVGDAGPANTCAPLFLCRSSRRFVGAPDALGAPQPRHQIARGVVLLNAPQ